MLKSSEYKAAMRLKSAVKFPARRASGSLERMVQCDRNVRLIKCYVVTHKCGHAETYPALPYESAVKMSKRMCPNCAMESPQ